MRYRYHMATWVGDPDPVSARRRTDPAHPPKPPGKKNKAKWCRGKPGIEHAWKVRIPTNTYGLFAGQACKMSVYYTGDGDLTRTWSTWLCGHRVVCTACGKVLRRATQSECFSGVLDLPGT